MNFFKNLVLAAGALAIVATGQPASAKLNSCEGPIVIGTAISITGAYSTLTGKWREMTEIFAEEFNKSTGGVKLSSCGGKRLPIKFVIYDEQSVPANAVALYEKMATVDKVDVFVGPDWSEIAFPVTQVFEKHKIPTVMSNVAAPKIYSRGFKYINGISLMAHVWSTNYFDVLEKMNPRPKTMFWVVQDTIFAKVILALNKPAAEKRGFKTVGNELFAGSTKDFTGLILKIKAAKPDVIYISALDAASTALIQQMRRLKVKAMDVHHIMASGALHRRANLEGVTGELYWHEGIKGPYSDLYLRVLKRAGINTFDYLWTGSRLDSYMVMIQAIERAGAVDREKIRAALREPGATWKRPGGDFKFNKQGLSQIVPFAHQIQNGQPVIIAPANRATGKMIWPSPSWQ